MTKFLKNADVTGYISQTSVTSSLVKTDSNGKLVAAVAGTDYATPGTIASSDKLIREVYNKTGATLTKGTVVYINDGQGNLPAVTKAIATGDSTSAQTFGVVQSDITNNNNGYVVIAGGLDNMNTQGLGVGTQLYLSSSTAGAYTITKQYAPNHLVYIGVVVRDHPTQGVIEIRIQNGYEMDELHNVAAQTPSNNDALFYETATSLWKNKSIAAVLGYTPEQPLTFGSPLSRTTNAVSIPAATSSVDGYLKATDWVIFNGKQNALTNPVTGTGTANYLPKFTGASTLGNSIIQESGTAIQVLGNVQVRGDWSTTFPVYQLLDTRTGGAEWNIENGRTLGNIEFYNGAAGGTKLTLTPSGYLGIGTASPTSLLHLSSAAPYIYIDDTSTSGTLNRFKYIFGDVGAVQTMSLNFDNTSNSSIVEVMTLNQQGKVGIATNNPNEYLTIGKNEAANSNAYSMSVLRGGTAASPGTYTTTPAILIRDFSADGPATQDLSGGIFRIEVGRIADTDANAVNATLVAISNDTGSALHINGKRQVGIGITSGTSTLNVSGSNTSSIPLLALKATGTGPWQRGVQLFNTALAATESIMYSVGKQDSSRMMGQFYFYYVGADSVSNRLSMGLHSVDDVFNIFGSSNVTIGTTTDSGYKLDVSGTGYFASTLTLGGGSRLSAVSGNGLNLNTGGVDRLFIASTGAATFSSNVNIGSSSSTRSVVTTNGQFYSYYAAESLPRITLDRDLLGGGLSGIGFADRDGTLATWGAAVGLSAERQLGFFVSNGTTLQKYAYINSSGIATFGQINSGNIGINTASLANTALRVVQNSNDNWTAGFSNNNVSAYGVYIDHSSATSSTIAAFQVYTPSGTGLKMQNNGRLLLGTFTDSGYTFDVNGTGRFQGAVTITTSNSPGLDIRKDASADNRYLRLTNTQASSKSWDLINQTNANSNKFVIYNATDNLAVLEIMPAGAATFLSDVTIGGLYTFSSWTTGTVNKIRGYSGNDDKSIQWNYNNSPAGTLIKDNNSFLLSVNGTNTIFGNSSGNVGIGTNSPSYTLHISKADNSFYIGSSTRGGSFVPQNNGTSNISYFSMRFDDNGVVDSVRLFNNYSGAGFGQGIAMYGAGDKVMGSLQMIQTDTSNTEAKFVLNLRNADASSAKVTVLGNGNVGIGTDSPSGSYGKLTVAGGIRIIGDNNAKLEIGRYSSGTTNSYIKLGPNATSLRFTNSTDAADILYLTNDANLGVGVSPTTILHAYDPSYNRFALRIQAETGNNAGRYTGIGFSGESPNTKGGIFFQSISSNSYSRGDMLFCLNNAQDQSSAVPSDAVLTLFTSTRNATFVGSVTATAFFESSDKNIKTLIQDNYQTKGIESVTAKLYVKNGKEELGYYAQDLQGILPSAVSAGADGLLSLSYREVHTAKIARLEKEVEELKSQLARL